MHRFMVRHGDSTTTGGRVFAFASTTFDDGKRVALHGEEATCGNCKGTFKIFGSGIDCTEDGRATVLHGDPVLCPCGKNKVIAGGDAGCHVQNGDLSRVNRIDDSFTSSASSTGPAVHGNRFVLRDWDGYALAHRAYGIRRETGSVEYGETDNAGRTHLLSSVGDAGSIQIFLVG